MKRRVLFLLGLLCLYFLGSVEAIAQDNTKTPVLQEANSNGKISGTLIDSLTARPVEYATVALLPKGSSQAREVTLTDATGKFQFLNVGVGEYEIVFSFIGFNNKTIPIIAVTENRREITLGNIKLAPSATALKEVTVEALRPTIVMEADRMVVSIAGTALAAGNTAYDVLAKAPGVFVDQDGNIQLNGRSGVTVMLDGKLTYLSSRDLRTLLEGMSAENIKNIEIITNPSAKYDAEGTSGILNINLRKNDVRGFNGSVYSGYTYNGKQHGYTSGGSVNYKAGNWNSFLNLDFARRVGGREATFTRVFYGVERETHFDQVATGNFQVQGPPSVRLGSDYSLSENNSVGFMVNYNTNYLKSDFLTDTYIGREANQPDLYIDADNYTENRFTNFTSNLHYLSKLDTIGSSISADVDFVKIRNSGESYFYNYFDSLASSSPVIQDFLYTDLPNGFDIYAAKADFTKVLSNGRKFEAGAKVSVVETDANSRFFFNNGDVPVPDLNRTNHFVYNENIYAAYLNWNSKLSERFTLQAGLRAEQTQSRGKSLTTGQVTKRDYLNLFPSVFVQQKVNEDYGINYSYSRRLYRPNYGNLNPFISYRDPYTYWQGNPNLRPQYTHAVSITQTFKKAYSLAFNYYYTSDVISEIPILDVETATTIYTLDNLNDYQSIGLTAVAPVKVMKNWDTNNTLTMSYNKFNAEVGNEQLVNDQLFYMLQSNHNILLPLKLRMEVNGAYRGPAVGGLYQMDPIWWVHIGLKKSFLEDKLEVSLRANDIFKSHRLRFKTDIGNNINDFDQYFRNRNVGITVRYNFSKGAKFDTKKRNSNLEELNRTGN